MKASGWENMAARSKSQGRFGEAWSTAALVLAYSAFQAMQVSMPCNASQRLAKAPTRRLHQLPESRPGPRRPCSWRTAPSTPMQVSMPCTVGRHVLLWIQAREEVLATGLICYSSLATIVHRLPGHAGVGVPAPHWQCCVLAQPLQRHATPRDCKAHEMASSTLYPSSSISMSCMEPAAADTMAPGQHLLQDDNASILASAQGVLQGMPCGGLEALQRHHARLARRQGLPLIHEASFQTCVQAGAARAGPGAAPAAG